MISHRKYNRNDIFILNRHHWIKIHQFIQEIVEPPEWLFEAFTPQKVDNSGYVSG